MSIQNEIDRIRSSVEAAHKKVEEKGGVTTTPYLVANLASAIDSIPIPDSEDLTDVLNTQEAKLNELLTVLDNKAQATPILQDKAVSPSTSTQTVTPDSGYDGLSEVTVEAIPDTYVQPSGTLDVTENGTHDVKNYASVNVNVASSGDGSGSTPSLPNATKKEVNFYDYDGTLLYSYTIEEAQALTELPALPTREGLTCQGWNYDLATIKSYNRAVDVGATYITDDGKTRLYIKIAAEGRMSVPLYFSQTVSNGVTINWGDGSTTETLSGMGNVNTTHTYASIGNYVISLDVASGCTLGFGHTSSGYCVMGSTGSNGRIYSNMLQKVEIGERITSIGSYAFQNCYSLSSIVIPNSVTSIGSYAFRYAHSFSSIVIPNSVTSIVNYAFSDCYSLSSIVIPNSVTSIDKHTFNACYSLSSIVIPNSVTSIGSYVFQNCYSLSSIVIPNSVTSIGSYVFQSCYGMAIYDFTSHTSVPTLGNTYAFSGIPSDCVIKVPASLYDEWIAATNWSTYASQIVAV